MTSGDSRIAPQIVANRAQNGEPSFDVDLGELFERADDLVQPRGVIYGHRYADFGRRHDVDRGLMALKDFEHASEKTVRHQHAR